MPEFRQNLATKEWVIIAPERAKRPSYSSRKKKKIILPEYEKCCPFCPGNSSEKDPAVFAVSEAGRWLLRVVPNKYAALLPEISPIRKRIANFLKVEGFGVAEVVIETREHNLTIATMDVSGVRRVILSYKERYEELMKKEGLDLITVFRNYGPLAGTSLAHPHSQIIATPIVPLWFRNQIEEARRYCDDTGRCVYCDIIENELKFNERIVMETEHFVVFEPYASKSPYETWILPKLHNSSFRHISDREISDLAPTLQNALIRLHNAVDNLNYNYFIRSAPIGDDTVEHYHWHIQIQPRITTPAGFELGSGIYINTTPPEEAARILRGQM